MNNDKIREVVNAIKSNVDNIFPDISGAAKRFMCRKTCELFLSGNKEQVSVLIDMLREAKESPMAVGYVEIMNEIMSTHDKGGGLQLNADGAGIGKEPGTVKENKPLENDSNRQEYGIHSYCLFFPEMQPEEYESLKEDIRINGLKVPIATNGNQVIDGRHRLKACRELGIEPKFKEIQGDPGELSISLNLHRNLTPSQKAAVAAEFMDDLEKEARKRQSTSSGGVNPQLIPNLEEAGKGRSSDALAKRLCVSAGYVNEAKSIREKYSFKFAEIKSGGKTLQQVKREIAKEYRGKKQDKSAVEYLKGLPVDVFKQMLNAMGIDKKLLLEKCYDEASGKARDLIVKRLDELTEKNSPDCKPFIMGEVA